MLYRLIRTFIICSSLLATACAHAENTNTVSTNETEASSFVGNVTIAQEEAVAEDLAAEISALEAELDSFSALDTFDLPDVDTSWLMKVKMGGAVVWQNVREHPVKYIAGTAATVAAIVTIIYLCKKKKSANPA